MNCLNNPNFSVTMIITKLNINYDSYSSKSNQSNKNLLSSILLNKLDTL